MPHIVTREFYPSTFASGLVDISMPVGHQAGDMTIIFASKHVGSNTITTDPSAGFTKLDGAPFGAESVAMFFKIHTGSNEPDIYLTGTNAFWAVTTVLLRGKTELSIDASFKNLNAGTVQGQGQNFAVGPIGTLTTTVDKCIVLSAIGIQNSKMLMLDELSLNNSVNLTKVMSSASGTGQNSGDGLCHITQYTNQITAGVTTDLKAICSSITSPSCHAMMVAVREAVPATATLSPMIKQAYKVFQHYGGAGRNETQNTPTANITFARHDAITYQNLRPHLATISIGGVPTAFNSAAGDIQILEYDELQSRWGRLTQVFSRCGQAAWGGISHLTSAPRDLENKIFSVEFSVERLGRNAIHPQGFAVYFEDSAGGWSAHQATGRDGIFINKLYRVFIDVSGSTPIDSSGTIDYTDITRVAYIYRTIVGQGLVHQGWRIKNAYILDKVVMVDGSPESPCSPAILEQILGGLNVATSGNGGFQLSTLQGRGQSLSRFGVQYGDGVRKTVTNLSSTSYELPLRDIGSEATRFWRVQDDAPAAEFRIKASPSDSFSSTACVVATETRQLYIIDPASSPSADYDFDGLSLVGWRVQNDVAGVVMNGVTFKDCHGITLNGGTVRGCSVVNPQVSPALTTTNPAEVRGTTFESAGTGHAIEITAPGTYTLFNNEFVGYGADNTTDAAIINNSGGAVVLNVTGFGNTPTVTNGAGATTTVNRNVVLTISGFASGSDVVIYDPAIASIGDAANVIQTFDEVAGTSVAFGYEFQAGASVNVGVFKAGFVPLVLDNISLAATDSTLPIFQQADRNYQP